LTPEPDNVPDAKRRAIEQRVLRISEALDTSPLLREAVDAISVQFERLQAVLEADEEKEEQTVDVVAYGLGSFSASSNAVYQLALLVALVRALAPWRAKTSKCPEVFDPVMNEVRGVNHPGGSDGGES
jgi:predicted secreted protein